MPSIHPDLKAWNHIVTVTICDHVSMFKLKVQVEVQFQS